MLASWLSQDLALDPGSCRTRVALRDGTVILDLPSLVATRARRGGRVEVVALGDEARALVGRTADGVTTHRPFRAGRVLDPVIAETWLSWLVQRIHGGRRWARPRILVAADLGRTDGGQADLRALRDACTSAGAREVAFAPAALATARGAGLSTSTRTGHLVVDLGAATTRLGVIAQDHVVAAATLEVAGDVLDGALLRLLKRDHALLVGAGTAEAIRRDLPRGVDTATAPGEAPVARTEGTVRVAGRCLRRGLPRAIELPVGPIVDALAEPVAAIGAAVRQLLAHTPDDLAADVVDHGLLLAGGASRVPGLAAALRASTGLAVLPVDPPDATTVRGLGLLLGEGWGLGSGATRRMTLAPGLPNPATGR